MPDTEPSRTGLTTSWKRRSLKLLNHSRPACYREKKVALPNFDAVLTLVHPPPFGGGIVMSNCPSVDRVRESAEKLKAETVGLDSNMSTRGVGCKHIENCMAAISHPSNPCHMAGVPLSHPSRLSPNPIPVGSTQPNSRPARWGGENKARSKWGSSVFGQCDALFVRQATCCAGLVA
jgi:hypothetical protein